ncbi:PAS domain-containing protein [Arenibaculum sp.]|jgi:PAS domain S-box-containing protein|uniref:PAS domain-containing protein n=1 Tax=Arenibaculum sp. TaxID=2865862 RepID=UPI002E135623|nr:PAS domain-containing protein [Arenibaculum sp.]
MADLVLTGVERRFDPDEIIVTKTDRGGRITYANRVFLRISGLTERQAIGAPHNVIRHPEMPACVFKVLWDTIQARREIFAYVLNRAVNGDHYWVFAHVTPTFDREDRITGYHSNRRVPDRRTVETVVAPLYRDLLAEERRHPRKSQAVAASLARLHTLLAEKGLDYERFVFSLQG